MLNGTCVIGAPGCSKGGPLRSGWCTVHYTRIRKYGAPDGCAWNERPADLPGELWRPVLRWADLYEISTLARIWSLNKPGHSGRILKPFTSGEYGYLAVKLCRNSEAVTCYVHSLVSETFIGELPPGWHTRHGVNGHLDNSLANLSQGTPKQNGEDMVRDGTSRPGSRNHGAKLTEAIVVDIRRRVTAGELQRVVAAQYGVTQGCVSTLMSRKTWRHC